MHVNMVVCMFYGYAYGYVKAVPMVMVIFICICSDHRLCPLHAIQVPLVAWCTREGVK